MQLAAILLALVMGWSNLQKELALIRHDLNQLLETNAAIQQQLQDVNHICREQEYRLKALEAGRAG